MLGLFKKKATAGEFGHVVMHYAKEFLATDAGASLGMRFDDFDGSKGWDKFLEQKGLPIALQKLHFRHFVHCALQGACTQFEASLRRAITEGGMSGFAAKVEGYDFVSSYENLEAAYCGQHNFPEHLRTLSNPEAGLPFLNNSNVGVVNAKYLLETFVFRHMTNADAFINDFQYYSSKVSASVGMVARAIDAAHKSFKIT